MENNKLSKHQGNDDSGGDNCDKGSGEIIEENEVKQSSVIGKSLNSVNSVNISRSASDVSLISNSQAEEVMNSNHVEDCLEKDDPEVPVEDVEKVLKRNLPCVNVPEKIILCLDITQDPDFIPFKLGDGSKHPPLSMVKRVTEIFVKSKSIINPSHEYALVVMESDSILWLRNFTSDPGDIISVIEDLNEAPQSDTFDLSSLFDVVKSHVLLPIVDDPVVVPPPYVVRTILLYSRSFCLPEFRNGRDSFEFLLSSQYFTLDILYIHEEPSERNKCEEIFKVLDSLDEKGLSYVFDVPRNATKLHHDMAKLLAHPLQRPVQKLAHYKLELQQRSQ